jgi:hypothetical protein
MKSARRKHEHPNGIDPQRAQHLDLAFRQLDEQGGVAQVLVDDSESPLAWLASRKGRDGRTMISSEQFIAGEKLRADFTKAHMTPRVTSSWDAPTGRAAPGSGAGEMADLVLAARQRVRRAMEACGPEFSGLLLDVCCFLRGLEDIERERGWPQRSAKIVLQLGLEKLARHYGFAHEVRGDGHGIRAWAAK